MQRIFLKSHQAHADTQGQRERICRKVRQYYPFSQPPSSDDRTSPTPAQTRNLTTGGRLPGLRPDVRERLHRAARLEPTAVLGVVEYWLATANAEGSPRVDS